MLNEINGSMMGLETEAVKALINFNHRTVGNIIFKLNS